MIATKVICDVCKGDAQDAQAIGGKVHVCQGCNTGAVAVLVREVVANWPVTCRCHFNHLNQQGMQR